MSGSSGPKPADYLPLYLSALRTLAGSFAMTIAAAKFAGDIAPGRRAFVLWACVAAMAGVAVLAHAVFRDVSDPRRTDPRSVSSYARAVCDATGYGFVAISAGAAVVLAFFAMRSYSS
jgi:hypothetical protein